MTIDHRHQVLADEQWERVEPLLPSNEGKMTGPRELEKIRDLIADVDIAMLTTTSKDNLRAMGSAG